MRIPRLYTERKLIDVTRAYAHLIYETWTNKIDEELNKRGKGDDIIIEDNSLAVAQNIFNKTVPSYIRKKLPTELSDFLKSDK